MLGCAVRIVLVSVLDKMPRLSVEGRTRVCRLLESGMSVGKVRLRLLEEAREYR